jgi:hypothetical protein
VPIVHPAVPNLDTLADLLAWPATEGPVNRIQIERSSTGGGTGYANIGSVTLVAGTLFYTFYDVAGVATDWYRWYFSNAANSFPIQANRDYSTEQQPAADGAGLLVSVDDVKQRLGTTTLDDETLLNIIREVGDDIENAVGMWLAPRPTNPASTMTMLFDVERTGSQLLLERSGRRAGIRTLTALGIATTDQPATGGTYTTATLSNVLLRPLPSVDGPALRLILSTGYFYEGWNTVSVTGSFGPASVAPRVQGVAHALIKLSVDQRPGVTSERIGDWSQTRDSSGSERDALLATLGTIPLVAS